MASRFARRVNVLFTREQFARLQAAALQDGRTISNLMRRILDLAIRERERSRRGRA